MLSAYIKSKSRIDKDVGIVIISVNERQVLKLMLLPVITQNLLLPAVAQNIKIQLNKPGLVTYKNIYLY
jgi:hypothetical protein